MTQLQELIDEERAVMGCILTLPNETLAMCDRQSLVKTDFHYETCSLLMSAVESLRDEKVAIDKVSVLSYMRDYGGLDLDHEIQICLDILPKDSDNQPTIDNLKGYIDRLVDRRIVRETQTLLREFTQKLGKEEDTRGQVREVASKLLKVSRAIEREVTKEEKIDSVASFWADGLLKDGVIHDSRWGDINNLLAGYRSKSFYILAARPSDGKTAFMKNELLYQALHGIPVAINCPDTTEEIIWQRIIGELSDKNAHRLNRQQEITNDDRCAVMEAALTAKQLPIFVSDKRMSFAEFYVWPAGLVSAEGVKFVVVDYIQLMKIKASDENSRARQLGELAYDLKETFKEMDVVGLVLSQLRRLGHTDIEQSPRPPALETLRDSGEIEQAADVVMMLYKEPGHNLREVFTLDNDWPMELSIEKNKEGPTGQLGFHFVRSKQVYMTPGEYMFRGKKNGRTR